VKPRILVKAHCGFALMVLLCGCGDKATVDAAAEAPPKTTVIEQQDVNLVEVERPERFALATAAPYNERPTLDVTGTVNPDVSRTVPVISLASGRVLDIRAKLGDHVHKGDLLMQIQSNDIATAFSDYEKAKADEVLARVQLGRSKLLYDKGAIAQKELEVAQDAEEKAKVDVATAEEHIRVLGAVVDHPSPIVNIYAPVSGVITEQNVTAAAGVKTLDNSPNLFTIADLSTVWVLCDVYENNLNFVKLRETADVRLDAYPDKVFRARIAEIGSVLDPTTRTAKVRLELPNPGMMRAGMFVTATFYGKSDQRVVLVPSTAVLHLHDHDWVYVPVSDHKFRRTEVTAGPLQSGGAQIVKTGLGPDQQVVANALQLTSEAQQ
jgi:cobalt-zinc-cadmium efflux system membrane fusion protein